MRAPASPRKSSSRGLGRPVKSLVVRVVDLIHVNDANLVLGASPMDDEWQVVAQ